MAFPPALLGVIAGTAIELVPDCYLPPVFDVLTTVGVLGVSMALGPLVAQFPAFAPGWQASLLGILEGLRGLPVERKAGVLNGFAQLLQTGFADVLYGFGAGLIGGLWDEVTFWFGVAWWLSGAGAVSAALGVLGSIDPVSVLWQALSMLDAAADAHRDGAEGSGEAPETGPPPVPEPTPPEATVPDAPADWSSLQEWLGGLVGNLTEAVGQIWASVAESVVVPLLTTAMSEGPWALGYGVGWGVSFLVVEAVLSALTVGLAGALTVGRAGLAGLKAAVGVGARALPKLLGATRAVLRWGDDLIAWLRKIPGVGEAIGWLDEIWGAAKRWLDDIVGDVDAPDAPKSPGPDGGSPDGGGKKKPGGGDENNETIEALRVWSALSDATDDHLRTRGDLQQVANRIAAKDRDIRTIAIDDEAKSHAWKADLVLTDGDRASTRSGWLATTEAGGRFYGDRDRSDHNEAVALDALDDAEQRWGELFAEQAPADPRAARAALQARVDRAVAPVHTPNVAFREEAALRLEVGDDVRIGPEDATVTIEAVVEPNATRRPKNASTNPRPGFDTLFPTVGRKVHDARFDPGVHGWVRDLDRQARAVGITVDWAALAGADPGEETEGMRTVREGAREGYHDRMGNARTRWDVVLTEVLNKHHLLGPLLEPTLKRGAAFLEEEGKRLGVAVTATPKRTQLQWTLGRQAFAPLFEAQTERYLAATFDPLLEWAEEVEEGAASLSISFSWSHHLRLAAGRAAIETGDKGIREWYEGERSTSGRSWSDRMYEEVKKRRVAFLRPTLAAAEGTLKAALAPLPDGTAEVRIDGAQLYLYIGGSPNSDLVNAVKKHGVVHFLREMAAHRAVDNVDPGDFVNPDTKVCTSWFWRPSGARENFNENHVKDRFRDAIDGHHEWIPCDLIVAIVAEAHEPKKAAKGAEWLELQHEMRTDTANLVYCPAWNQPFADALLDVIAVHERTGEAIADLIAARELRAEGLGLTGHPGALYLTEGGRKRPKSKKDKAFHAGLISRWRFDDAPIDYVNAVIGFVRVEGENGFLWTGHRTLRRVIPEPFIPHAGALPSSYLGKSGVDWGDDLGSLARAVESRYDAMILELSDLAAKLARSGSR